jgi:hypothetical protein
MTSPSETHAYYRAALRALAFVEHRQPTGRRFGSEADARWSSFQGDLTTADRIDLLIRDADAQWPAAFGARTVFARETVSEDEPFGPDWEPLPPVQAEEMWRATFAEDPSKDGSAALSAIARAWELELGPFDVGAVGPAEKLVVAGPSAVAALQELFAGNTDLDWAEQVTVVATPPGHRQLAAVCGALLNATKRARILTASTELTVPNARLVVSQDAHDADAAKAGEVTGG